MENGKEWMTYDVQKKGQEHDIVTHLYLRSMDFQTPTTELI